MEEIAIGICCQAGEFVYDPWTLLKLRRVSCGIKKRADEALGDELKSQRWYSSFRVPLSLETNLSPMIKDLRRFCAALGGPPACFILNYTMVVDCSARNGTALIAPPLSFLAQLCTIGIRIMLTARVVGKHDGICIGGGRQRETVSLDTVVLLPSVTQLCVSGKDAATKSVLQWLLSCCSSADGKAPLWLEAVTFMEYTLTRQGATALMSQLARLPGLKILNLPQNTLEGLTLKELPALTSLTELDLSINYLHRSVERFATALAPLTRIRRLNLASNCLGGVLGTIASAFPPALTGLDLSANGLGFDRLAIADLLSRLPALTSLDLSFNALRVKGARALPLSRLTALTLLDITNNGILEDSPSWVPGVPWLARRGPHEIGDTVKGFYFV